LPFCNCRNLCQFDHPAWTTFWTIHLLWRSAKSRSLKAVSFSDTDDTDDIHDNSRANLYFNNTLASKHPLSLSTIYYEPLNSSLPVS
jgi:hypothetical protein